MTKKFFSKNEVLLFLGALLLVPLLAASIFSINLLEQVVSHRRQSLAIQAELDDVNDDIKKLEILKERMFRLPNVLSQNEIDKLYVTIKKDLSDIQKLIINDPIQVERFINLRDQIADVRGMPIEFALPKFASIEKILRQMDSYEYDQQTGLHDPGIFKSLSKIHYIMMALSVLAIGLVFFAGIRLKQEVQYRRKIQKALESSEQMAVQAADIKSKFLATMSHEIRTPLNGIISLSDVLRRTGLTGQAKDYIELIHGSGRTLLRIINDILDYSKIESGQVSIIRENVNIRDLVEQTISVLQFKASEKSLYLKSKVQNEVSENFKIDGDRIAQILYNLIGNAIKFTDSGGVMVSVTKSNASQPRLHFSVKDTGRGMSEVVKANLFTPFSPSEIGTSGEAGTGLGLAISRQLIELMGGEIKVESNRSLGTQISFSIPAQSVSESPTDKQVLLSEHRSPEAAQALLNLFNLDTIPSVLVVEDNPTNQIIAQSLIEGLGAHVVLAANGQEAVEICKNKDFDLIFMDCQMPEMDGFEATKALRLSIKHKSTPIIALTANVMPEEREKCTKSGMDDFLAKPITVSGLEDKMKKHLGRHLVSRILPVAERPEAFSLKNDILLELENEVGLETTNRIIKSFIGQLPAFRQSIMEAIKKESFEELKFISHRFKSSAKTIGANEFASLCEKIEKAPGFSKEVIALCEQVLEECKGLEKSLNAS